MNSGFKALTTQAIHLLATINQLVARMSLSRTAGCRRRYSSTVITSGPRHRPSEVRLSTAIEGGLLHFSLLLCMTETGRMRLS